MSQCVSISAKQWKRVTRSEVRKTFSVSGMPAEGVEELEDKQRAGWKQQSHELPLLELGTDHRLLR